MSGASQGNKIRHWVAGFAGGYFLVGFVSFIILTRYWIGNAPKVPAPTSGMIYAYNQHGWISYFTAFQVTASSLLFSSNFTALFLLFVFMPKRDIKVTQWRGIPLGAAWKNDDIPNRNDWSGAAGAVFGVIAVFVLGPLVVSWLNGQGIVLGL